MRIHIMQRQNGFSLVEVLVALILTSVGLLGLANLQLNSLRNTSSAGQRFDATTLAYDILERMRANRRQATLGAYDIDIGEHAAGGNTAAQDLAAWKTALTTIPEGDGSVRVDGTQTTITVQWTDAVSNGEPQTSRIHLRTVL